MKAALFDLDDTLYSEVDFVESGFRAAARYLSSRYFLEEKDLFEQMLDILRNNGRGKVFDSLLEDRDLFSEERTKLLLYLYRDHRPDTIKLHDDTMATLDCLKSSGMRLGIITDGMASVQKNKVTSLGLEKLFDVIIYTDGLGKDCWKPSPIPFKVAFELLGVIPSEAVYVGDDPSKDFLGPNSLGTLTIQVKRPRQPGSIPISEAQHEQGEATFVVDGLNKILPIIFNPVYS